MDRRAFLGSLAVVPALRLEFRPDVRYSLVPSGIEVLRGNGNRWSREQFIPSRSPAALAFDPLRHFLHVANDVAEYEFLPRGTVETYSIKPDGRLSFLTRDALSLSATNPRSLAVSPDGRYLAVACYRGGIYNLFAIDAEGSLVLTGIFKETGSGPDPRQFSAHPHSLAFDSSGRFLISTDFGCDRVSVFALRGGALERVSRISAPPGSGPGRLEFDANGSHISVVHELTGGTSRYRIEDGSLFRL